MNRFLLALLALFVGLAAQIAPAQARQAGGGETAEVGSVESIRAAKPSPSPAAEVDSPVLRQSKRDRAGTKPRPSGSRVFIPSVLFGADRAFE